MKMFKTKKLIIVAMAAIVLVITTTVFQSCSSDLDDVVYVDNNTRTNSKINKSKLVKQPEILSSREFEEFIQANIELTKVLKTLDSIPKFKHLRNSEQNGVTYDGKKYNKVSTKKEIQLFQKVSIKKTAILKKYPELAKLSFIEMKNLVLEATSKSDIIRKSLNENGLINKKKQNVRQKIGINEGNGIFAFDDVNEAFLSAMFFTMISGNECAGYALANGTSVLYINPNGQQLSGSYPVPFDFSCKNNVGIAIYNGQQVIGTYHTHPDISSGNYSPTDNYTQIRYFQDCPMIILYDGAAYYYNYNNGYNNGTPSAIWYY